MPDEQMRDTPWSQEELDAAAALDDEIAASLRGAPTVDTEPGVLWLTAAIRTEPPRTLRQRVMRHARERPAWKPFRVVAAVLAALLMIHGISGFFAGEWVADNLGEPFSRHAAFEAGFALMAAAVAVGAGALQRRWAPVSVATGAPLGTLLAAHGVREITIFPYGAALHLAEGALGIALLIIFLRSRRYRRRRRREDMT